MPSISHKCCETLRLCKKELYNHDKDVEYEGNV